MTTIWLKVVKPMGWGKGGGVIKWRRKKKEEKKNGYELSNWKNSMLLFKLLHFLQEGNVNFNV